MINIITNMGDICKHMSSIKINYIIMATKRFRNNFKFLSRLFDTPEKFAQYLIDQKSLDEGFMRNVTETKTNNSNLDDFNYLNVNLDYEVGYDIEKNKICVNVAQNNIFSYWDTEDELMGKMKKYIKNEEYEKAKVLHEYLNTIDLYYEL